MHLVLFSSPAVDERWREFFILLSSYWTVRLLSTEKPGYLIPSPWRQLFGNFTSSQEPRHTITQARRQHKRHTHIHICDKNRTHEQNKPSELQQRAILTFTSRCQVLNIAKTMTQVFCSNYEQRTVSCRFNFHTGTH